MEQQLSDMLAEASGLLMEGRPQECFWLLHAGVPPLTSPLQPDPLQPAQHLAGCDVYTLMATAAAICARGGGAGRGGGGIVSGGEDLALWWYRSLCCRLLELRVCEGLMAVGEVLHVRTGGR